MAHMHKYFIVRIITLYANSVTSVPEDLTPSPGLHRHLVTRGAQTDIDVDILLIHIKLNLRILILKAIILVEKNESELEHFIHSSFSYRNLDTRVVPKLRLWL